MTDPHLLTRPEATRRACIGVSTLGCPSLPQHAVDAVTIMRRLTDAYSVLARLPVMRPLLDAVGGGGREADP